MAISESEGGHGPFRYMGEREGVTVQFFPDTTRLGLPYMPILISWGGARGVN